jgi:hypothetical protein
LLLVIHFCAFFGLFFYFGQCIFLSDIKTKENWLSYLKANAFYSCQLKEELRKMKETKDIIPT